jgi:hypothetical protein
VAAEASDRAAAVAAEASDRAAAVTAEASARNTAIAGAVSAEVTARNTAIESAVSAEASARNTAIASAVSAEASARNTAIASAVATYSPDIIRFKPASQHLVANGQITVTHGYHTLTAPSGQQTGIFSTINGGDIGSMLYLDVAPNMTITVVDSNDATDTGNIYLSHLSTNDYSNSHYIMSSRDHIVLIKKYTGVWTEISRDMIGSRVASIEQIVDISVDVNYYLSVQYKYLRVHFSVLNNRNPIGNTMIFLAAMQFSFSTPFSNTYSAYHFTPLSVYQDPRNDNFYYAIINTYVYAGFSMNVNNDNYRILTVSVKNADETITYSTISEPVTIGTYTN